MYVIEKLVKLYKEIILKEKNVYNYLNEENEQLEDIVTCRHTFLPIDSTGKILACSKCGYVVTKKWLQENQKRRKASKNSSKHKN